MTDLQESDLPPELVEEWNRLQRRRKVAEALGQQEPLKGQMVGRFYVPPSPWQGAANVTGQLLGAWQGKRADKDSAAFRQRYSDMQKTEIARVGGDPTGLASDFPKVRGLAEVKAKVAAAMAKANDPTTQQQNFAALKGMPPADKPAFMDIIRGPRTVDLGGTVLQLGSPAAGTSGTVMPKTPTPGQDPNLIGAQTSAREAAKADIKKAVAQPKAKLQMEQSLVPLNALLKSATELSGHAGLSHITGATKGRLPPPTYVLDQDGSNALSLYEAISNKLSGAALQAMRDSSKTGGAVGQVTEKEWPRLRDLLSTLSRTQDPKTFQKRLGEIIEQVEHMNSTISQAYEETYGGQPASSGAPSSAPGVIDFNSLPPGK